MKICPPDLRRAFTLLELLVVITIIGILMGLLLPAVVPIINSGKKTQAKNDAVQIANAVAAYELEYGKLPIFPAGSSGDAELDVGGDLLKVLTASDPVNNPRKVLFLETQDARHGRSGVTPDGTFVDPWGGVYRISLDGDYDNKLEITVPKTTGSGTESVTIKRKAAVWNSNSNYRLNVRSWE